MQRTFEIAVIRKSNRQGHRSYGWFGDEKLLISHNGGPCHWPLTEKVWDKLVALAKNVAEELNAEEFGEGEGVALTENQQKRLRELRMYLVEIKEVERNDFDKWFEGKKTFAANIGAWLLLIENDQ